MIAWIGRVARILLAAAIVCAPASGRAQSRPDRRLAAVTERAEALLAKLELEAARALLEEAARNRAHRRASGRAKGRLFVTLGRARAELGDPVGAEAAFRSAVRWSPEVSLPSSASPKIRAALERVRAEVKAELAKARPPASRDRRRPRPRRATAKPPPSRPPQREASPRPPPEAGAPPTPAPAAAPPAAPVAAGLDVRVERRGREVRFVLTPRRLSRRAELVGHVAPRRLGPSAARVLAATRTGTTAELRVPVDRSGLVAWFEARRGGEVLARAGSPADPIRVAPLEGPPALADAWSEPPTSTKMPGLAPASRPPSTPPPAAALAGTETATTPARQPMTSWGPGLSEVEVWGLAAGAVVLTAGLITLAVVLSEGASCGAPEGFGCTRVQIQPLVRF